jgi:GNAT superfamily N-acetyltransferase
MMQFELLGWPAEGPTLALDYRRFSYAGKFVMSATGKAVVREAGAGDAAPAEHDADTLADHGGADTRDVVAAAAFDADRTDETVCRIRYITVREDRRGEGIGARLAAFVAERARERGFERARIAVNNPFAYQALYRAGFHFTGDETGVAELVLDRPLEDDARQVADRSRERYQAGLDRYRERDRSPDEPDLSTDERTFLDEKRGADPPAPVALET